MQVVDAILHVWQNISDWSSVLTTRITTIWNSILNVLSYVVRIFQAIRYALTSLLTSAKELLSQVIEWDVFFQVWSALSKLTDYLWWPAVVFLATMLLLALFRIAIAFVFKILKLNLDYHSTWEKQRSENKRVSVSEAYKSLFDE